MRPGQGSDDHPGPGRDRGPESVADDGFLDPPPGRRGQPDRERRLGQPDPARRALLRERRRGQRDDRPVPQVDPVGPDPDPAQYGPAEHPADQARGRRGQHHAARRQRRDQQPGRVEHPVRPGEVAHGPGQHGDPGQAHRVGDPGVVTVHRPQRACGRQPAQRPGQRQRRPDEQGRGVRVGAVIHPRRVRAGHVDQGHGQRGQGRSGPGHAGPEAAGPAGLEDHEQEQRPDQVELLLDGQRPQVLERWRRPELGEVRVVRQRLPPVAGVGDRGEQRRPERGQLGRLDHGRGRGHHDEQDRQGRQQPPGPPGPESAQVQPAVPVPLGGQQVGDQVSAEHEEDVDPEEPPGKCGQLLMKGNNGNNGQCAQPIQARPS